MQLTEEQRATMSRRFASDNSDHLAIVREINTELSKQLHTFRRNQSAVAKSGVAVFFAELLDYIPFFHIPGTLIIYGSGGYGGIHIKDSIDQYPEYNETFKAAIEVLSWCLQGRDLDFSVKEVQDFTLTMIPLIKGERLKDLEAKIDAPEVHERPAPSFFSQHTAGQAVSYIKKQIWPDPAKTPREKALPEAFFAGEASKAIEAARGATNSDYYLYGEGRDFSISAIVDGTKTQMAAIAKTVSQTMGCSARP